MDVQAPAPHLKEKYGVVVAYSTAAKNLKEMGIRLKVPRPVHPKAASAEERLAFQREAREEIAEGAKAGHHTAFVDEGHAQGYKNGRETAACDKLRAGVAYGVQAPRTYGRTLRALASLSRHFYAAPGGAGHGCDSA